MLSDKETKEKSIRVTIDRKRMFHNSFLDDDPKTVIVEASVG